MVFIVILGALLASFSIGSASDLFVVSAIRRFSFEGIVLDVPISKEIADKAISEKLGEDPALTTGPNPRVTILMGRLTDDSLQDILPIPSAGIGRNYKAMYVDMPNLTNGSDESPEFILPINRFYEKQMMHFDPLFNDLLIPMLVNHINVGPKKFSMRTDNELFQVNYERPPKGCPKPAWYDENGMNASKMFLVYGSPVQLRICDFLDEYCSMRGECNLKHNFCATLNERPEVKEAFTLTDNDLCVDLHPVDTIEICEITVNIESMGDEIRSATLLDDLIIGPSGANMTALFVKTSYEVDLKWPCL